MDRATVVAEARRWVGTPWKHQGHTLGVGSDCAGVLRGVLASTGLLPPVEQWPDSARFMGYAEQPDGETFISACERYLRRIPLDKAQPGDVVVIRFKEHPQHIGMLTPYQHGGFALLHALKKLGKVCEHRLSPEWKSKIVAAYSLPGVN